MDAVPALLQDQSLEDPLDSPEQLHDQLESLSYLCRFQYEQFSEYLCGLMDPILGAYTQALTSPGDMPTLSFSCPSMPFSLCGLPVPCGFSFEPLPFGPPLLLMQPNITHASSMHRRSHLLHEINASQELGGYMQPASMHVQFTRDSGRVSTASVYIGPSMTAAKAAGFNEHALWMPMLMFKSCSHLDGSANGVMVGPSHGLDVLG